MKKFRYYIIPDALYIIQVGNDTIEMSGKDILESIYLRMDDGR